MKRNFQEEVLIVEFAAQLRDLGKEFGETLLEAAYGQFPLILMTGIATAKGPLSMPLSKRICSF